MITITALVEFIESVFGKGHLSRNLNFDVRCPICNPSDFSKKKLSILLPSCKSHCWVCGFRSRSLAPLIKKYGTQTHLEKYAAIFGEINNNHIVTGEHQTKKQLELPKDFSLITLANDSNPDVRAAKRYLNSRGITERDCWYFKLGISFEPRWHRRIILPSFDAVGRLNFFTARSIDKDKKPKYDSPEVDKNPIIFNDLNVDWKKRLTLVEGPFDLIKCPDNSTAILGSDLDERHELFNKILLNDTPVALALDGDMWNTKMPKIVKKFEAYNIDIVVVDVRPWGDPGSMSKAEFEKTLSEARHLTWNDMLMDKISRAANSHQSLF